MLRAVFFCVAEKFVNALNWNDATVDCSPEIVDDRVLVGAGDSNVLVETPVIAQEILNRGYCAFLNDQAE